MKILTYLCAILLIIYGAFLFGLKKGKEREPKTVEIVKTVTIRDTVEIPEPMPYLIENIDTVYVEVVKSADEPLIKQRITYTDSTYKAVVSGYNPKLEYIETYNTTHYITEKVYEKPKKWHLGVYADIKFYGKVYAPIGGKVSYRNNRWELSGKIGKDLITHEVLGEIGASWDLVRF